MSNNMWLTDYDSAWSSMENYSVGLSFTVTKDIDVSSLRIKPADNTSWTVKLSDSLGNLVASKSVNSSQYIWYQLDLDTPVRLEVGETYTLWTTCGPSLGDMYRQMMTAPTFDSIFENVTRKTQAGSSMPTANENINWWYLSLMYDEVSEAPIKKHKFAMFI